MLFSEADVLRADFSFSFSSCYFHTASNYAQVRVFFQSSIPLSYRFIIAVRHLFLFFPTTTTRKTKHIFLFFLLLRFVLGLEQQLLLFANVVNSHTHTLSALGFILTFVRLSDTGLSRLPFSLMVAIIAIFCEF
jgi:hypothetical protein